MTSSAVKIPDLKSVPPGFTKTFQRGYRSVVETNSSPEAPQPLGTCCLLKSFWSHMLPQRELLSHKTSRPSCTCGSSAPCGLPLSADPAYLPTSSGRRSVRAKSATASSEVCCCLEPGASTVRNETVQFYCISATTHRRRTSDRQIRGDVEMMSNTRCEQRGLDRLLKST